MHPDVVRLETVVVCRVTDHASGTRQLLERFNLSVIQGPQRFLHQHVLAVRQEIGQHPNFGLVGNAHEGRVVAGHRHVLDGAVLRFFVDRIHRRDVVGSGEFPTFMALDSETDDEGFHQSLRALELAANL